MPVTCECGKRSIADVVYHTRGPARRPAPVSPARPAPSSAPVGTIPETAADCQRRFWQRYEVSLIEAAIGGAPRTPTTIDDWLAIDRHLAAIATARAARWRSIGRSDGTRRWPAPSGAGGATRWTMVRCRAAFAEAQPDALAALHTLPVPARSFDLFETEDPFSMALLALSQQP